MNTFIFFFSITGRKCHTPKNLKIAHVHVQENTSKKYLGKSIRDFFYLFPVNCCLKFSF